MGAIDLNGPGRYELNSLDLNGPERYELNSFGCTRLLSTATIILIQLLVEMSPRAHLRVVGMLRFMSLT